MPYWFVEAISPDQVPRLRERFPEVGFWASQVDRTLTDVEFEEMRKRLDRDVYDRATAKSTVDNIIIEGSREQASKFREILSETSTVPKITRDPSWFFDKFGIPDWKRPFWLSTTKKVGTAVGVVAIGGVITKALEWW